MNKTLILALSLFIAGNAQACDNKGISNEAKEELIGLSGALTGALVPLAIGATGPNCIVDQVQGLLGLKTHSAAAKTCICATALGIMGLGCIGVFKVFAKDSLPEKLSGSAVLGSAVALAACIII